jgi:uncharacterized membrane protein YdbT with pleckstrin-like domain
VASYVDSNLLPSEVVTYRAHVSLWTLFPLIVPGILTIFAAGALILVYSASIRESTAELSILLIVMGVGFFFFLLAYINYTTTEFAVTDKRIIAKTGLVARNTVEMFLDKVESLNVDQSVTGRLLGYGSVGIRGTGVTEEVIRNISDPLMLRKQFMSAADNYRQKI